MLQEKRRFLGC